MKRLCSLNPVFKNKISSSAVSLNSSFLNSKSFSTLCYKRDAFTSHIDVNLDRLKSVEKPTETVENYRTPTHTIHFVINTINKLERATTDKLYEEISNNHPGALASKRHLKKLLTTLKHGNKVVAIQPLRGQLTNKKVSFEYKLTKTMKNKLSKKPTTDLVKVESTTDNLSEDELFDRTLEAMNKV
ncbi:hypothetical protein ABK040_016778 [Willaertia magna]